MRLARLSGNFRPHRLLLSLVLAVVAATASSSVHADWLQSTRSGTVAYFLFDAPARIERYDMSSRDWLSPIQLGDAPTAFAADDETLYVAFGRRISRMNLDGTGETVLTEAPYSAREMVVGPVALYLFHEDPVVLSVDKRTGSTIAERSYSNALTGLSLSRTEGRLVGQATNVSPADIRAIDTGDDGGLGIMRYTPHHGTLPVAARTWVSQDGARVVNDAGVVYTTVGLAYANSLGAPIDDLSPLGDDMIVLRGATLFLHRSSFLEAGRYFMDRTARRIFAQGGTVFGFDLDDQGVLYVVTVPMAFFAPAPPGAVADPHGLAYRISDVFLDAQGVVYLLSRENHNIFRWSVPDAGYLPTIPLIDSGMHMAYAASLHRIYVASFYPSTIWAIELAADTQVPIANLPLRPLGLTMAGDHLFATHPSGLSDAAYLTFDAGGGMISRSEDGNYSREYSWNPVTRRMYFFKDDRIPNDLAWRAIDDNGVITSRGDSPYHGEVRTEPPIRIAPDGTVLLLGSGEFYDAMSLVRVGTLPNSIADAVWLRGGLFTIRSLPPHTEIQQWSETYTLQHSFLVRGTPVRLLAYGNQLLIITSVDGVPRFSLRRPRGRPRRQ